MIIEEKITFDRFIRWMLTAVVVIAVLLLMNYLSSVLLPFFVAWLLAVQDARANEDSVNSGYAVVHGRRNRGNLLSHNSPDDRPV